MMMTSMERGSFAAIPLGSLFPETPLHDLERVREVVAATDTALREYGGTWEWALHHATFPGGSTPGVPEILLASVVMETENQYDWLEFDLDVEWTPTGRLRVVAAVNVACFCAIDHNSHYTDELALIVDQGSPLSEAFEAASQQLITWLNGSHDPAWWRTRAELPRP
jgi:hypothetical protein